MQLRFLASVLVVLGLTACGRGCGSTTGTDASVARAPATVPTGALALAATDDAKRFLDALRAQFRDRGSAAPIPEGAAEVVAGVATLPEQVLRHIPANAAVRSMWVAEDDVIRQVTAVRVTRESNAAQPFGVEVPIFGGGPDGSSWVMGRPSGSGAAVALYGSVLVVGETERSVSSAGRYLAEVALAEPAGEGVSVHVYGSAFDGPLRAFVDESLEEQAAAAIASARAERARHAESTFFGEPERLVEAVRDRVRHLSAYLPDLASLDLRIVANASGVSIDGRSAVEPRTPLARALAGMELGIPFAFEALPESTALAIASRRSSGEAPIVELLAPIAGTRMSAEDRSALTTAADRLATMRGNASLLAIGGHADGSFALFAADPGTTPLETSAVDAVVRSGYARSLLAGLVGCDDAAQASLASGRARLCRIPEGPEPTLELERGPDANVLVLAARAPGATNRHAVSHPIADASARVAARGLFADPDSARALAALSDRSFFAIALGARGVVPSFGLLGNDRLRTLGGSRALPNTAAPIVFGLSREEDGALGIDLVAPPRAIEEVYSLIMLAVVLASGG